jgi:hypothetical protein
MGKSTSFKNGTKPRQNGPLRCLRLGSQRPSLRLDTRHRLRLRRLKIGAAADCDPEQLRRLKIAAADGQDETPLLEDEAPLDPLTPQAPLGEDTTALHHITLRAIEASTPEEQKAMTPEALTRIKNLVSEVLKAVSESLDTGKNIIHMLTMSSMDMQAGATEGHPVAFTQNAVMELIKSCQAFNEKQAADLEILKAYTGNACTTRSLQALIGRMDFPH